MRSSLVVLLSTCNGERFLAEQLDSLLRQSWRDFVVLARDDGSSDGSRALLEDYAAHHPERFCVLAEDPVNRGASASFARLLETALAGDVLPGLAPDYLMFCDQDDIWVEDKIDRQMRLMKKAEQGDGSVPALVHGDLTVVSCDNELIAPSFAAYQGLDTERDRLGEIAASNPVTGCTALINAALARRALPIPADAIMHDWWLALVASAFGKLAYCREPLVRYRQHGGNAIGARPHVAARLSRAAHWRRLAMGAASSHLLEVGAQARAFLRQYHDQLEAGQRRSLRLCSLLRLRQGLLQRIVYRLVR